MKLEAIAERVSPDFDLRDAAGMILIDTDDPSDGGRPTRSESQARVARRFHASFVAMLAEGLCTARRTGINGRALWGRARIA